MAKIIIFTIYNLGRRGLEVQKKCFYEAYLSEHTFFLSFMYNSAHPKNEEKMLQYYKIILPSVPPGFEHQL